MAAKTLEEVLATLSGDERKLFDSTLSKHPELKDGWLRQDDYSRKMTEVQGQQKKVQELEAENEKWDAWAKRNVPIWDGLVADGVVNQDGEVVWKTQKAELEQQLDEARKAAVAGADMKPEELDAKVREIVKAAGGVTREEYEALVASQSKKIAEETFTQQWTEREKAFNEKTIPFVAGFSSAAAIVANHFESETGEKWTAERQKEMYDLMTKEQNFDPFKIEEKLLAPFREKKATEAKIEEEVQKRLKNSRAETGGDDFIPQSESSKGALRQMLERSAGAGDFEGMIADQARKAGTELRTEGKA